MIANLLADGKGSLPHSPAVPAVWANPPPPILQRRFERQLVS